MSGVLNRQTINALVAVVPQAVVATFGEGDWRALGLQTGMLDLVERHPRLLRGVKWRNEDYPDVALTVVTKMLGRDFSNLGVMLSNSKIVAWLRENAPELYGEIFAEDELIAASVDHEAALRAFLWRPASSGSLTRGFKGQAHDAMLYRLRSLADGRLPGPPRVTVFQSLQDAGCDLLIDWGRGAKYGIQMKSHGDIGEPDFSVKTLSQIADSKQHGLRRLYLLFAGDVTDRSQSQKVRGFEARVSRMKDHYVVTVSPERVWTLLFGEK
jgi:hypothetical protein